MKNRKISIKRNRVFQIALKGRGNRILPERTLTIQCMTTFSKAWLIKIIMTCVSIKPEVKKDTISMTTTTNGACIGWLDENCNLMGKEWQF